MNIRVASLDIERRIEGAGARMLAPPQANVPAERRSAVVQKASHAEPAAKRILKKRLELASSAAGAHGPVSMDDIKTGYEQLFPRAAAQPQASGSAAAIRSASDGHETEIWTVFSGPKGAKAEAKLGRTIELDHPSGLLVALRAGF